MSAKTDNALQSIQNIIAFGMPHKDEMYAVQGYCDMLKEEIAELEADIETLHTDLNTIVPELHNEIDRVKGARDAWKATACMMPEWMTEVCQQCPLGYLHKCPDNADHSTVCKAANADHSTVCKAAVLAHFSAPEEDA